MPTFNVMIMATQALAEYVALAANRAAATVRVAAADAADFVSENFLVVLAVMVGIVLLFTFSQGRR